MFKKYTIIALGALVLSGQASGMGSWGRKLWAPAAVSASVFTAKATLCQGENGNPNGYIDRFKAWAGWNTYGVASSSPIVKSDQMPEHVRQALDKKALNKGASEPELSVFTPQDLSDACKACNVSILGSDEDNWVSKFSGTKTPDAVMRHIRFLAYAAEKGSPVDKSKAKYDILNQTPCLLFYLLNEKDAGDQLKKFASMQNGDLESVSDYHKLRHEVLKKELEADLFASRHKDGATIKKELQQQAGYWKCFREKVMTQGNESDAYDAQKDCSSAYGNYCDHDAELASRSFDGMLEKAEKARQKAAEERSKARIARVEREKAWTQCAKDEIAK